MQYYLVLLGNIYTKNVLDAEGEFKYRFSVVAHDNGVPSLSSTCLVQIKVTDENDNAPFFVLPHKNKILIREELSTGTEVVQVRANDPDSGPNGEVTYSLVSGK